MLDAGAGTSAITVVDAEEKTATSMQSHREIATLQPSTSTSTIDRDTEQHPDAEPMGSMADPLALMLAADSNQSLSTGAAASTSIGPIRNASDGTSGATAGTSSGSAIRGVVNSYETLLSSGSFSQILDVSADTDDETMVELAIALSLQDHEGGHSDLQVLRQGFQQSLSNLQGLENLPNLSEPALQSLQALAAQSLSQVQSGSQARYRNLASMYLSRWRGQ